MNMQKRVYFFRTSDQVCLAMPAGLPMKQYKSTLDAGFQRCTLKWYRTVQRLRLFAAQRAKKAA